MTTTPLEPISDPNVIPDDAPPVNPVAPGEDPGPRPDDVPEGSPDTSVAVGR